MNPGSSPTARNATASHTAAAIDAAAITVELVRELVNGQFPQWAPLPIRPVENGGNDHRTFRLGDELVVRLPSAPGYVPQVEKEQSWLPRLAPQVPLPIPAVRGIGVASPRFPAPWSVYGWLDGAVPTTEQIRADAALAADLADFLVALRGADTTGAPEAGLHSAYRGGAVAHWDSEMRDLVERVTGRERDRAEGLWRDALAASISAAPVWVHGDVAIGNLLVRGGVLAAVLDFGCSAIGDPACDTVIYWTQFDGDARHVFRAESHLDDATWARGRGWALWKALILLSNRPSGQAELGRRVLDELFAGV